MTERIADLVVDESHWLPIAMLLSLLLVAVLVVRRRRQGASRRHELLWALNVYYGCVIGVMASGHLLAVSVKVARDTLEGRPAILYPIGLALALPAAWLVLAAAALPGNEEPAKRRMAALNVWLGALLMALGLHNWPLAVPAALNIAYQVHSRRTVGRIIGTVAIAGYIALFAGAVVFMASGQSFEEFSRSP